jgi:hypothetical protein
MNKKTTLFSYINIFYANDSNVTLIVATCIRWKFGRNMHGMVSFNVHIKAFFILALRSNISYMEDNSPASSSESDGAKRKKNH